MASTFISNCVNGTCLPVRSTFPNLYKWPESDVEFVKMVNSNNCGGGPNVLFPSGVDCLSRRQIYLRSYKFSRKKEGVTKKAMKCLRRLKESMVCAINKLNLKGKYKVPGRAKHVTYATSLTIFHRLLVLSCSVKVDVTRHDD